ncbi:CRAL/TRIO domain-containing protein [Hortaea werneckii]|uniref:CRAL-TRIO domain-containing protein n=1 Tax=Hortaea werneckii EXF-2000 TaxID=1157616 RepID=A0A1Z5TVD4_HORWE|nr:CRAL/TRIO domain-containing protein [Hortaea werneckii]OTA39987.1 hypothetical protein BTJ68_00094 [Hortaea werneckii EXF-2000]KAI6793282.1 CRAL/TRIO domain-containing protein [Hortaea werneckii]KAI6897444.1 CRAL/TRIO domain-containing protein [Hortaea werneckii]KAI6918557.1 CRAL/TRIO domain-containing protein [Hortaea werneckii]
MSYQANGADLQRTESYTWPAAHVGHLNETQQTQLDKFRRLCESKGYYTPATEDTPATHDDETLLRYLRARKFNPEQAFDQLKDTEDWRKANDLDQLYETIDIDEYEQTRRLYPQWTGRRDKRGIPFYVYEIGQVDAKAVSAYSSDRDSSSSKSKSTNTTSTTSSQTPRKMLRLFALYENLCRFVLPLCSLVPDRSHSETPISQSSNVVDLSGVGITKFWALRNHMSDASQLATAHYPETLDRIFVVGAPSFFPTVWEYAKRWFDPITVSKIFILSEKNMRSTLEQYVDLDNLPKKYGGNLDWEFGDMPALDPGIVKALDWEETIEQKGHKTLPIGPIRWEYEDENGKKGDLVAKAIGTEKGKPRRNVIAGLHPEAGLARLALSPGRQSVPGNKSQSVSTATSATAASVQSSTPAAAAAVSSSTPSQDYQTTTSTTTSEPKGSTEGKNMNAPADYMKPVEGEEGGSQTMNTSTASEGEGKNTYLDYSGLGGGVGAGATAAGGAAGAAGATAGTGTLDPTTTTTTTTNASSNQTSSSPSSSAPQQETRQGTSSTRYAQQEMTHAAGQLASGTPQTKTDSQGEKQGIMEPGTVGQAPKKHPVVDELGADMKGGDNDGGNGGGSGGSGGSGVMGQASSYANSAVQSAKSGAGVVMGAVGIGGSGGSGKQEEEKREQEEEEAQKEKEKRRDDPEVERMDGRNVEEFLRSKTASAAEPMKR